MTRFFRSAAARAFRPSPSVTPISRFTRASTRLSSASWRKEASGRKNAPPAARACCTNTAASARSPAAPNTCSTARAAAHAKTAAKSTPNVRAPGSSFTSGSRRSASSTGSKKSSRPRTGTEANPAATAPSSAKTTEFDWVVQPLVLLSYKLSYFWSHV